MIKNIMVKEIRYTSELLTNVYVSSCENTNLKKKIKTVKTNKQTNKHKKRTWTIFARITRLAYLVIACTVCSIVHWTCLVIYIVVVLVYSGRTLGIMESVEQLFCHV
jgi:uncharacterized membrane protein